MCAKSSEGLRRVIAGLLVSRRPLVHMWHRCPYQQPASPSSWQRRHPCRASSRCRFCCSWLSVRQSAALEDSRSCDVAWRFRAPGMRRLEQEAASTNRSGLLLQVGLAGLVALVATGHRICSVTLEIGEPNNLRLRLSEPWRTG